MVAEYCVLLGVARRGFPFFDSMVQFEGDTVIMECLLSEAQLMGEVGVMWLRDGVPLQASERVMFTCQLEQTLVLSGFTSLDIGSYMCMAAGEFSASNFFFLTFFGELPR